MSIGQDPIFEEDDARREAEKVLRFKIGPQYSLGEPSRTGSNGYVFPIDIRLPRVLFDETRSKPVDVKYLASKTVGEITVESRDDVEYTHPNSVYSNVRDIEEQVQKVVEKALLSAAAKDFTSLPFPENRYAPVEDLLGEVILKGTVPIESIAELEPDDDDDDKYSRYIRRLEKDELIRRENGNLVAGSILASIQRDTDHNHEALNGALAHFFEENIDDLGKIHQILGPYLAIAGFYYRQSIGRETLPLIGEEEIRDAFRAHYSGLGKKTKLKEFKMSRYLLHLERAGILESHTKSNARMWSGNMEIKNEFEQQTQYLGTIVEI